LPISWSPTLCSGRMNCGRRAVKKMSALGLAACSTNPRISSRGPETAGGSSPSEANGPGRPKNVVAPRETRDAARRPPPLPPQEEPPRGQEHRAQPRRREHEVERVGGEDPAVRPERAHPPVA